MAQNINNLGGNSHQSILFNKKLLYKIKKYKP